MKYRYFTAIHVAGLSLGLTCCLLISFFIRHEFSFDRHHLKGDRIYRIGVVETSPHGIRHSGGTPYPCGEAMRLDFEDLEQVVQIYQAGEVGLKLPGGTRYPVENIVFAEPSFVDVFDIKTSRGDISHSLSTPNRAVIDETTARLLFGDDDPLGQVLSVNNVITVEVGAVMQDLPTNTHLPASIMLSHESLSAEFVGIEIKNWGVTVGGATYVLLPPGIPPSTYEGRLQAFADKYMNSEEDSGFSHALTLQALADIHFQPHYSSNSPVTPIRPIYLWIFACIGLLVLAIASFNFINLSTVQALKRHKEVGVRKVLGANRRQLMQQFLGEALIISFVAGVLACAFAMFSLPYVNDLLNKQIDTAIFSYLPNGLIIVGLPLLIGILSGIYPALVLSRYEPASALVPSHRRGRSGSQWLRRSLVVAQYTITIGLIIGTIVVSRQVRYMEGKDLGFQKQGIVMLDIPQQDQLEPLRSEWLRDPSIHQVTFTLGAPTSVNNIGTSFHPKGMDPSVHTYRMDLKTVDYAYADTYDLELVAGRWMTKEEDRRAALEVPSEDRSYVFVVNEALAKQVGHADPAAMVGQRLITGINDIEAEVIGVVKDFHSTSLHNEIEPTLFIHFPRLDYRAGLKIDLADTKATLAHIEDVWTRQFPDDYFNATFLDETIALLYDNEQRLFQLFRIFTTLAIVIGALGLFGLVSYIVELRTKEIGIRKVLGATVGSILLLVSKEFIMIVGSAILLAIPMAWYCMERWLQNFAFHINLGLGIFVLAILITFSITIGAVGFQSARAALMNPVDSLRNE